MTGPDTDTLASLADVGMQVIASGGIASEEDIFGIIGLGRPNITGAIIGKALYEGAISLPSIIKLTAGRAGVR